VAEVTGEQEPVQAQEKAEQQATVQTEQVQEPAPEPQSQTVEQPGQTEQSGVGNGEQAGQVGTSPQHAYGISAEDAINQAAQAADAGDLGGAETALEPVVGTSPKAKCALAVVRFRQGRYADAARLAEDAVGRLKKADKCLQVLFDARVAQRDYTELANFLSTYANRHPESVTAANLAVRVLIYQDKPSEAVRRAKDVLKHAETDIDVMKTLAMGYLAMKRYDAARFVIAQIQEINKEDPDALDMLAWILVKTGKKRAAIPLFMQAIEKAPHLYDARIELGLLNMEAGDYQPAEEQFRAAIKLMPGRVDAYIDPGTLLTKVLRFDEARKVLHKALEISPNNALAYFNLGVVDLSDKPADFDRPEHYKKAIAWFKKYQEHAGYVSSNDPVYKYIDEAKRMAQQQELLLQQMQQVPKEQQQPAPQPEPAHEKEQPAPQPAPDAKPTGKPGRHGREK